MPDENLNAKLDAGLSTAFRAWQEEQNPNDVDAGISISLRYEGDLAAIEALGFERHMVSRDGAMGIVRFKDIPALVAHPGVLWMATGRLRTVDLETAVPDIKARGNTLSGGSPVNGLWHADVTSGALTNVTNGNGDGVIIAIIDTGIDYKHPMFMSQFAPRKETRILKIWDQGLVPTAFSDCPHPDRLTSKAAGISYGVEYNEAEIEADLNGGTAILHKDCDGHGTHCAGIAAGGTVFPTTAPVGEARHVGVAPRASIIAVKYMDNPTPIFYRLPSNAVGATVTDTTRFRDAVLYCLRTARDEFNKPVVISMSLGDSGKPGDGLDAEAQFVDGLLDPNATAGDDNFPKGAIVCKSAGNNGNIAQRRTARIVVPASGQIVVPFELLDTRGSEYRSWEQCAKRIFKPRIAVHFWYRAPAIVGAVQFAMRLPNDTVFGSNVSNGAELEIGYIPIIGPPPRVVGAAVSTSVHRAGIKSEIPAAVPHPNVAGSVHRHHMTFFVRPKESTGAITYNPGIYEVRITAPAGTVIFALCPPQFWGSLSVRFRISALMQNGTARPGPPDITVTEESSSVDTLGQHVITVASYDDQNGGGSTATKGSIAASSSRGPLRNFSDPAAPLAVIAAKPDIAAPGVNIMSAEGLDTEPPVTGRLPSFAHGLRFTEHSGTSMATPMVAGVIALMMDKKPDLNITEARAALFTAPQPVVNPSAPPASTNAYGRGRVDALTSHANT